MQPAAAGPRMSTCGVRARRLSRRVSNRRHRPPLPHFTLRSAPFDEHRRRVVEEDTVLVLEDRLVQAAQGLCSRTPLGGMAEHKIDQPLDPEELAGGITRFDNAVGIDEQPVARFEVLLTDLRSNQLQSERNVENLLEALDHTPLPHQQYRWVSGCDPPPYP